VHETHFYKGLSVKVAHFYKGLLCLLATLARLKTIWRMSLGPAIDMPDGNVVLSALVSGHDLSGKLGFDA
jgi:hypothetical protein